MNKAQIGRSFDRRSFIRSAGLGVGAGILGMQYSCKSGAVTVATPPVVADETVITPPAIQGFDDIGDESNAKKIWTPISDRKIRVGLVGFGYCQFSAQFGFQNHPNVEIVAVSDLIPERCAQLAKVARCDKTYPSLEEMVKDPNIEAIFVATDAPRHAQNCIDVLNHGKHVASAVPAVWGSLDDAHRLFETVKRTGLKYMMFETSMFHAQLYAMRQIHKAGGFGNIVYTEGEYFHYTDQPIPSFENWRVGFPPQWYPTPGDAYYIGVSGGSFLEVSCHGTRVDMESYQPNNNAYKNPFANEVALHRTSDGGTARMAACFHVYGYHCECGRLRGTKGSYDNRYSGMVQNLPNLERPPLPTGVEAGGHGGSHGRLMDEFVTSILQDRKPLVDIATALNMTVGGIVAHQSAMRDGELLKIPQFKL